VPRSKRCTKKGKEEQSAAEGWEEGDREMEGFLWLRK